MLLHTSYVCNKCKFGCLAEEEMEILHKIANFEKKNCKNSYYVKIACLIAAQETTVKVSQH